MIPEIDTQKTLESILETLKALDARLARVEAGTKENGSESSTAAATPAASRKMSIKEFLLERAASDDVQKTLAIGYFLETQEGMSSFNKTDLEKGFRAAKETVPANINDKVNMSIKNGHMMDAAEKKNSLKAWNLTSSGEKYLQNGFKKALSKKDN
jgi:hypothetical protein